MDRRSARSLTLVVAILWTGGWMLGFWRAVDDSRGATVDAEVVAITTNAPGRRVYDVRFVTETGLTCESRVDSGSNPKPREIHVGGRSRVHYSASDPCSGLLLRETTSPAPWPGVILLLVPIVVCLVVVWRLRPRKVGQ
ncbi:hypothetical protein GCM10010399_72650 [Dactylosporangium fulvum]